MTTPSASTRVTISHCRDILGGALYFILRRGFGFNRSPRVIYEEPISRNPPCRAIATKVALIDLDLLAFVTPQHHIMRRPPRLAAELADEIMNANTAAEAVTAAEDYQAWISGRVSDLTVQREAIVTCRGTGNKESNDGAALALIQADLEGVQPIMEEAA